jgi:hypothetical protein
MDKHSVWKKAGTRVIDKLFQYRFVQQFAALSYKNGEQGCCCCWAHGHDA